ncbi:MAG TPA: polysaccharide biosynthesis C-terminal domain-containing protein [Phnomibacter sp.]|nr:polysaccharide biosynthesis C-terminal domain-containing protein [Phnomibacter sp.]
MSSVKKLAGQTLWYGVPTIASRFLGYILSIFLFRWYGPSVTADITQVYALIPFLNILFTYGLETAYFRFVSATNESKLFNTLSISIIGTTVLFSAVLLFFIEPLSQFTSLQNKPEYFRWMIYVLFFDTLSVIPFARLRQQERPRRYAFAKVMNVLLTVLISVYYLRFCPLHHAADPNDPLVIFYNPSIGIGYYIIANAMASFITMLLLWKEWKGFQWQFDTALWKQVMNYAYPLIIVGFGGMINEMLSRLVYSNVLDLPIEEEKRQLGIFGASYKVAVLITMFIQVFKMAAEPFFFKQSADKNAPRTYARVMKFFVIACSLMWLAIALALPLITRLAYGKNFEQYNEGSAIIPILAMGSVFLGVYYNLSIWYKLTNKTWTGAWITIGGAVVTIVLNIWWIPLFGYTGSAFATFICYGAMMVVSYTMGQKHYPIPYAYKKYIAFVLIAVCIYLLQHYAIEPFISNTIARISISIVWYLAYVYLIVRVEKKELAALPMVGKMIARL